jgi:hypothetical protein
MVYKVDVLTPKNLFNSSKLNSFADDSLVVAPPTTPETPLDPLSSCPRGLKLFNTSMDCFEDDDLTEEDGFEQHQAVNAFKRRRSVPPAVHFTFSSADVLCSKQSKLVDVCFRDPPAAAAAAGPEEDMLNDLTRVQRSNSDEKEHPTYC